MEHLMEVPIEPLSRKAFAPYGVLIAAGGEAPDYTRAGLDIWHLDFQSDSPLRLQIMRYHHKPFTFDKLECHVRNEGRVPLGGARAVLAVAGGAAEWPEEPPPPESVRAFLIDGSAGLLFRPGVWHSLDCFPLAPPHADFAFLSDEATEQEIESWDGPASGARTRVADYGARGVVFRIVDPARVAGTALAAD